VGRGRIAARGLRHPVATGYVPYRQLAARSGVLASLRRVYFDKVLGARARVGAARGCLPVTVRRRGGALAIRRQALLDLRDAV
jgi:hypothetical protein